MPGSVPASAFAMPDASARTPRGPRVTTILLIGKLAGRSGETICRIRNISDHGLMAEVHGTFGVDDKVEVRLKAGDVLHGRVRWSLNGRIGMEFDGPVNVAELLGHVANRIGPEGIARGPRFDVDCRAELLVAHQRHEVRLIDLSQGGARLFADLRMERDSIVRLIVPSLGEREAAVRWVGEGAYGLSFLEPLAFADFGAWLSRRPGLDPGPLAIL
ncbi:PilZ domain-containing protein [Novosphingobium sp. ZW T3_23]|uniref:PilZ domain-containing protein n=1 Tax=Novosphingobium sp. ZW T3_23 TaxID=3378084 RepID=UPI00385485FD